MTVPSRESIMQALFTLLQSASGFTSYSRKMTFPENVPPALQPCLIMYEGNESNTNPAGGAPAFNTLHVHVVIYATNPPKSQWAADQICGASLLNPLMDAVEDAITFDPFSGLQTLGGLVYRLLWDDGQTTIKDVGDTDANGQGIAIMPIKIELNP